MTGHTNLSATLGVTLAALVLLLAMRLILGASLDPLLVQAIGAVILLVAPLLALRQAGRVWLPSRPSRQVATYAALIGVLASVAGAWLLSVVNGLLTAWIGALPTAVPTETDRLAILLIEGIAMPLAQGVLFWIFIQRAAGPVRLRGAWLAAWLFAGAAVLISNAGVSAGAAALPQGIGAAMITAISGTGWAGVIAAVTYGLASLLLPPYLLNWLGINALSPNWAAAALFSLFGIFFLLQTAQARLPQAEKLVDSEAEQLRRQPFLWLFVVLVVIFVGLEIFLRSRPA